MEVDHDNIRHDKRVVCETEYQSCRTLQTYWTDSQNFNKKLQCGTISSEEMMWIAEALDVGYEQAFVFPDGSEIKIGSKQSGGVYCND